ncbi:hypothetical protein P167DRAFT_138969 [Morchella conica CCBAS932]|uniref:Uncharacterized protein n=1 Tax=Morchella conica CCBAS932 TaxID=1392247 RepID=A0A3N4KX62_9PEZI|nr:hypothetical protein P167DRAFT_138969 [Morchella conica CCBAS932]
MATKKQPMNFGLGPEICMGEKSTKTLHIYSLKNLNIFLKIQKNNQMIALSLAITLIAILNFQTCFSWSSERASVEKRGWRLHCKSCNTHNSNNLLAAKCPFFLNRPIADARWPLQPKMGFSVLTLNPRYM